MAGEAIEVPFSDNESEEVTDDQLIVEADKPGDSPEVKAERAQKRRERAQSRERERKEVIEANKALAAENAEVKSRLARLEGYVTALPAGNQPQHGKDPYEAALDGVYEERSNAYQQMQAELKAGTLDEKRAKHYERVSRDIEGRISTIHAEKAVNSRVPQQRQEAAQQQYVSKYPEVYNNAPAFEYAKGEFAKRTARAKVTGEQLTNEVVDEIMQEAKTVFKLGGKSAPTRNDRDRLSGLSSSSGGGGGENRGGIAMTPALRKMAIALHPEMSEEKAIKTWVDTAGKELRKQKVL